MTETQIYPTDLKSDAIFFWSITAWSASFALVPYKVKFLLFVWSLFGSKTERNLLNQISDLRKEQAGINATEEFAKFAKIDRKIYKLKHELTQIRCSKVFVNFTVNFVLRALITILMGIISIFLIWRHSSTPLIVLPVNIFYPFSTYLSYPSRVPGGISIAIWMYLVTFTSRNIVSTMEKIRWSIRTIPIDY